MDFWTTTAFAILLEVLTKKEKVKQFGSVIAKVYVKIEKLARMDQTLTEAIRLQRSKEGLE